MALRVPESENGEPHKPAELDTREWGEDVVLAEPDNIGGWIKADSDIVVCPVSKR